MYGNSKHASFSVRNPFPIPIRCSIPMYDETKKVRRKKKRRSLKYFLMEGRSL